MEVTIIKEFPGVKVGENYVVSDDGMVECSQYCIEFLIKGGWVEECKKKESLAITFNCIYVAEIFSDMQNLMPSVKNIKHGL